jgi:hypothetical protein
VDGHSGPARPVSAYVAVSTGKVVLGKRQRLAAEAALSERTWAKYNVSAQTTCTPRPTRAAAQRT